MVEKSQLMIMMHRLPVLTETLELFSQSNLALQRKSEDTQD